MVPKELQNRGPEKLTIFNDIYKFFLENSKTPTLDFVAMADVS